MTMHLVGPYMTTTNYKKRKTKKLSENQRNKLELEWKAYNKRMRQNNCHAAQFNTLEDYIAYTRGQYKSKSTPTNERYVPTEGYRRETDNYPSLSNSMCGFAPKKESQKYTGDLIVGIGTMHKSNMVPIMRGTNEAKDIAQMRRN